MKKSTIYKIGGGVAAVVTVAAPTLGVVYGTKDWRYHNPQINKGTPIEQYFDDTIASTKSTYLSEKIVSPVGGTDLSSTFVVLDPNWIDFGHIQKMIKVDGVGRPVDITLDIINTLEKVNISTGNVQQRYKFSESEFDRLKAGALNIDVADYKSQAAVEEKLLSVNKMLSDYQNSLGMNNKRIGLYTYPVFNTRSIAIRIYELQDFEKQDSDLITDLYERLKVKFPTTSDKSQLTPEQIKWMGQIKDFKNKIAEIPANASPDEIDNVYNQFPQLFGGEHFLETGYHLARWYRLNDGDEQSVLDEIGLRFKTPEQLAQLQTPESKRDAAKEEVIRIEGTDKGHGTRDNYESVQTSVHFTGGDDDHEIYGLRSFWDRDMLVTQKPVLDLQSHEFKIVLTFYKFDKNDNTVTFNDGQIQKVFNPINIDTKTISMPLDIFGDTTSTVARTPENYELFRQIVTDPSVNSFIKWIRQPLTEPGLDILGSVIPTLKSPVARAVKTWKKISRLCELNKNFKNDVFSDANVDELLKKIEASPDIDASEFWRVCFIDFPKELESYWSSIDKLASLGRHGIYELYNMVTGFNIIADWVDAKIDANPEYKQIALADDTTSGISALLFELKKQHVVSSDFSIDDILNNPIQAITTIVKGIIGAPSFSLKHEDASILIGLIGQLVKLPEETQRKLEAPIGDFISSKDGIQNLIKFILGDRTLDDLIKAVWEDKNYMKIVEFIATNKHVDPHLIETITNLAVDSGVLPKSISDIIPTSTASAQMIANIFNKGAIGDIYKGVEHILNMGVGDVDQGKMEDVVKSIRDAVKTQDVIDVMAIFKTSNPFEVLAMSDDVKKDIAHMNSWGDLKKLVNDAVALIDPNTHIKFGNTGKTVFEVLSHIKDLVNKVTIADSDDLMKSITGLSQEGANGVELVQTMLGMLVYMGSDSIDKAHDQSYKLIASVINLLKDKLDWTSLDGQLGMLMDPLVFQAHDTGMAAGEQVGYEKTMVDKIDDNGQVVKVEGYVTKPNATSAVETFVDHIFEQAKAAGFNLDAYKAALHSKTDWIQEMFSGPADEFGTPVVGGMPIIHQLVDSTAHLAGNPVASFASYLSDNLIHSIISTVLHPLQNGLLSGTGVSSNSQVISTGEIKGILDFVKLFLPADMSFNTGTISSIAEAVLTTGYSALSAHDIDEIVGEIKDILPDEFKGILSREFINKILSTGFPSLADLKATFENAAPGLWNKLLVDQNVYSSGPINVSIQLSIGGILTSIYNGQELRVTPTTIVPEAIKSSTTQKISPLLTTGLLNLTPAQIAGVITGIKGAVDDIHALMTAHIDALFGAVKVDVEAELRKSESTAKYLTLVADIQKTIASLTSGNELQKTIETLQSALNKGIDAVTADEYNLIITDAMTLIKKLQDNVPSLQSNSAINQINAILELVKGKGDTVYHILHDGLKGSIAENARTSELLVTLLRKFAPSIPSLIMDYIPKVIVGQDNLDQLIKIVNADMTKYTIPVEAKVSQGVSITANIGSYSQLVSKAREYQNQVQTGDPKNISAVLEAFSNYKIQIDKITARNHYIENLNTIKTKIDDIVAHPDQHVPTYNGDKSQIQVVKLNKASSFVFAEVPGVKFDITKITPQGTDSTDAKLTIQVTSDPAGVTSRTYEVVVSGFAAQTKPEATDVVAKVLEIMHNHGIYDKNGITTLATRAASPWTTAGKDAAAKVLEMSNEFKAYVLSAFKSTEVHNAVNALRTDASYSEFVRGAAALGLFRFIIENPNLNTYAQLVSEGHASKATPSGTKLPDLFDAMDKEK